MVVIKWLKLNYPYPYRALLDGLQYLNFHSLEVVSRWRDPQLQVTESFDSSFHNRAFTCE